MPNQMVVRQVVDLTSEVMLLDLFGIKHSAILTRVHLGLHHLLRRFHHHDSAIGRTSAGKDG